MNIVLINPQIKTWSPDIYPPLGLAYVASALESAGHAVRILDLNSRKVADYTIKDYLLLAEIVGITGLITEYKEVIRLTNVAKKANSNAKIVLGGALATTWTEKVLFNSQADIAVIGEGEETIVKLVETIEKGSDYSSIKGIAYKKGREVIINPVAEPIANLDAIPFPARHLLDMNRYSTHHFKDVGMRIKGKVKATTLLSSRGCPYGCVFCFKDVWGRRWRGRSAFNIIEEILQLQDDYGYNGFVFNDDTFVLDRERVKQFCDALISNNINISWYCNGRVNLMTEELINLMAKAGCKGIAYGIESGNQGILNSIKKSITLEQVEKITQATKKAGIHIKGYFMIGMLGETKETIHQTMDFARKLDLDLSVFDITTPMAGTALYKMAEEKGLIGSQELDDWSLHASVNLTQDCTKAELEQISKQAFREFAIEKQFGKHYLFNYKLWLQGFKTLFTLAGKRSYGTLFKKVWALIIRR